MDRIKGIVATTAASFWPSCRAVVHAAFTALILVAAVLGWLNYHATDDVQLVAAGLLLAGFGFSFWRPGLVWLFVPVLWFAIPLSGVVADASNYHPQNCVLIRLKHDKRALADAF